MRRSPFALASMAFLTACASAPPQSASPIQTEIELTFPGDADAARDAVVAAFELALYEGAIPSLRRGNANLSVRRANRFHVAARTTLRGRTARIRAGFTRGEAPGETAIVLTGYHSQTRVADADLPIAPGPREPITAACTHTCAAFWATMQRVVEALRAEGAELATAGGGGAQVEE